MDIGYWILDPHVRVYISTGKVQKGLSWTITMLFDGTFTSYLLELSSTIWTLITPGLQVTLLPVDITLLEITTRRYVC